MSEWSKRRDTAWIADANESLRTASDLMRQPFLLPEGATIKRVKHQVTAARAVRREAQPSFGVRFRFRDHGRSWNRGGTAQGYLSARSK